MGPQKGDVVTVSVGSDHHYDGVGAVGARSGLHKDGVIAVGAGSGPHIYRPVAVGAGSLKPLTSLSVVIVFKKSICKPIPVSSRYACV